MTVVISIISSGVLSAIVSILFLKGREKWIEERTRRYSVVFDDRYSAYKNIYMLLLNMSENSKNLYILGEKGNWTYHYKKLKEIIIQDDEIKEIVHKNGLIIDEEIFPILMKIHEKIDYYRRVFADDVVIPDEASIGINYYNELVQRAERIEEHIEEGKELFRKIFRKKY